MKRFVCYLLFITIVITFLPLASLAYENGEISSVTYFEDGSYIVEKIVINYARASGTKTGAKESTYYGNSGSAEWKATLTGTFTYTGSSATCTASSISVTIYDSNWYTISKSASKSGNTAYGSVTMGYKMTGVTVDEVSKNLSLKCDANGNLS